MAGKTTHVLLDDVFLLVVILLVALALKVSGALDAAVLAVSGLSLVGAFVVGIFYTSIFTVGPATLILAEFAEHEPIVLVAGIAGLGAVLGDFLIFKLFRDRLGESLAAFMVRKFGKKKVELSKVNKVVLLCIGAGIIASPIPDEVGLALMGLSKVDTKLFIALAWVMNSLGILIIGILARAL